MAFVNVYLGLGSNQGDREGNLREAVSCLDKAFGTPHAALSHILETASWGFQGNPFLNACVLYRLPRRGSAATQAESILRVCKEIERSLGRKEEALFAEDGTRIYRDRPIDIDLLFYGTEHLETEDLTVPHPLIGERDFVKIPLREIAKPSLRRAFPELFD